MLLFNYYIIVAWIKIDGLSFWQGSWLIEMIFTNIFYKFEFSDQSDVMVDTVIGNWTMSVAVITTVSLLSDPGPPQSVPLLWRNPAAHNTTLPTVASSSPHL